MPQIFGLRGGHDQLRQAHNSTLRDLDASPETVARGLLQQAPVRRSPSKHDCALRMLPSFQSLIQMFWCRRSFAAVWRRVASCVLV